MKEISKVELGLWPTPFGRMKQTEKLLGLDTARQRIYIKRDDLGGLGAGGNKVRCLETILGEAVSQGADTLIAYGPLQSNLCSLAAAAAARSGLGCVLIFNAEKPERFEGNQLLNRLLGSETIFLGSVSPEERNAYAEQYAETLTAQGRRPYIIRNGGSSGIGALGYMGVIQELAEAYRPDENGRLTLFVPGGNGGVAGGLIYGNAVSGRRFDIVVISVEDEAEVLRQHIESIVTEAAEIAGEPLEGGIFDSVTVTDAYRGAGWSVNTPESEAEVFELARTEGIFVENVYTSKVLVGMKDMLRKGTVSGNVCYLHTGGFGSLFSQY